jgi:hypothetical protein
VSAVAGAGSNDTVVVKPGTHTVAGATIASPGIDVVGQSGGATPVINVMGPVVFGATATGSKLRNVVVQGSLGAVVASSAVTITDIEVSAGGACVIFTAPGSSLADSKLTQTGAFPGSCLSGVDNTTIRNVEVATSGPSSPFPAVQLQGSGISVDRLVTSGSSGVTLTQGIAPGAPVMRRSRITMTSSAPVPGILAPALWVGAGAVVTDTLVRATGAGLAGGAVAVSATGGKLRNVTGIATGIGSRGLSLQAPLAPVVPVSVKNSIFRAGDPASDVVVDPPFTILCPVICPGPSDLTITHSNFRAVTGTLNAASGSNQASDPQLDADLRPATGSPVIDAGVDDPDNGPADLGGRQRKLGSAVDMGAFEFDPPLPPLAAPGGTPLEPQVEVPVVDRANPALSSLGITNKVFRVGPQATTVAARAKAGTTFVYTLSEAATVTVGIERASTGRRKGKSCVKPTKRNRKAKKCTLYTPVGAIAGRPAVTGPNALPFSGRIGRKALKPGAYRAALTAVDAAGNRSAAKTIAFKIVKK